MKRFIDKLYAKCDKLQKPPFHPKWRDINLAATVPGWKRYSVAEQALREKMNGGGNGAGA